MCSILHVVWLLAVNNSIYGLLDFELQLRGRRNVQDIRSCCEQVVKADSWDAYKYHEAPMTVQGVTALSFCSKKKLLFDLRKRLAR